MRLPDGYNIHHPDWLRTQYNRNQITRTLRQLGALASLIEVHDDLHANIDPLPRMSLDLARFSLEVIAESRLGMARNQSGLRVLEARMLAYDALGRARHRLAPEARRFGEHFEDQYQYLKDGAL